MKVIFFLFFLSTTCQLIAQELWSLQECIEIAYENNLDIRSKQIENGKGLISLRIAKNEYLPDVNAYANFYTKFGQSQDIFGTTRRNDNLNSDIGINSNILLYNHGRLQKEVERAENNVLIQEFELEIIKRNIAKSVAEAFLMVQLNMEYVRSADSSVRYARIQYDKVRKSTAVGSTALSVESEAKANWTTEKQRLLSAQQELIRSRIKLAQIMVVENYEFFTIETPSKSYDFLLKDDVRNVSQSIEEAFVIDPVLKRLDAFEKSLLLNESILKTSYYPTLQASVSIGSLYFNSFTNAGNMSLFRQMQGNFAQQIAMTLSIPIFNKGRIKNEIAQNRIELERSRIEVDKQKNEIRQDYSRLLYDLRAYREQYRVSFEVLVSVKEALEFTRKSFEAGRSTIYDLNMSNKNYLLAESDLIKMKYNCFYTIHLLELLLTGTVQSFN